MQWLLAKCTQNDHFPILNASDKRRPPGGGGGGYLAHELHKRGQAAAESNKLLGKGVCKAVIGRSAL